MGKQSRTLDKRGTRSRVFSTEPSDNCLLIRDAGIFVIPARLFGAGDKGDQSNGRQTFEFRLRVSLFYCSFVFLDLHDFLVCQSGSSG